MWSLMVKGREDPVTQARHLARRLLRKQLPERWEYTRGVARAVTVGQADRDVLVVASWLHHIEVLHGWPDRVSALVAHQSGARFVPVERGFGDLMGESSSRTLSSPTR